MRSRTILPVSANTDTKDGASRLAAYSFWMTDLDHQMRIRRLFDHIERALLLYYDRHPDVNGSSGPWHVVADMRTPDALVSNGFVSSMSIEEDDQERQMQGTQCLLARFLVVRLPTHRRPPKTIQES